MKASVAVLVSFFVVAVGISAEDDGQADIQKLEGNWEIVSIEAQGKKMDSGKGAPDKAVFKNGKVIFFSEGKEIPTFKDLRLELVPKQKPKAVDLVRGEKEALPCIYEVSGNALKLAMPLGPQEKKPGELLSRPESFDTKDKPFLVLTAKRSKG